MTLLNSYRFLAACAAANYDDFIKAAKADFLAACAAANVFILTMS
tara:strand:+ start:3032 stop:3166 length:135 start_codon:yes stop_codon:yes gene_type:complete